MVMSRRILVIGSGFLGSKLIHKLKNLGVDVIGTHFSEKSNNSVHLDITDSIQIENLFSSFKPNLVINCAANTQVDYLETHPELAYLINSHGASNVADECNKKSIKMIHISTDSIFDGTRGSYTENDKPNPINIYAKSKLLGEELIKKNCSNFIIIRTNFFGFNSEGKFLLNSIVNALKESKEFIGFYDAYFSPLEISNLSDMIIELGNSNLSGIFHLSSDNMISKYQFACEIAKAFGFDTELIKRGSIDDFKFIAMRPKNTSLVNTKAKKYLKTKMIPIHDALKNIKKFY